MVPLPVVDARYKMLKPSRFREHALPTSTRRPVRAPAYRPRRLGLFEYIPRFLFPGGGQPEGIEMYIGGGALLLIIILVLLFL
jgi:hypothetical protein